MTHWEKRLLLTLWGKLKKNVPIKQHTKIKKNRKFKRVTKLSMRKFQKYTNHTNEKKSTTHVKTNLFFPRHFLIQDFATEIKPFFILLSFLKNAFLKQIENFEADFLKIHFFYRSITVQKLWLQQFFPKINLNSYFDIFFKGR